MNQSSLKSIDSYCWENIRLIASDLDGTLTKSKQAPSFHGGVSWTQGEKFDAKLFQALVKLSDAKINVLITTGRSAGWVQAIATYFPVVGAIAENGGLIYWNHDPQPQMLSEIDLRQHRQQLEQVFKLLQTKFPQIRESLDNTFRLTDWTFDVENLSSAELETISEVCQSEGYGFTYSTIQCHIKPIYQDKAYGLNRVMTQYFPELKPDQILTIGDSPNDESMFNQEQFPLSVGVANVRQYCGRLKYLPAYVTNAAQGEGFCELAELILQHQGQ